MLLCSLGFFFFLLIMNVYSSPSQSPASACLWAHHRGNFEEDKNDFDAKFSSHLCHAEHQHYAFFPCKTLHVLRFTDHCIFTSSKSWTYQSKLCTKYQLLSHGLLRWNCGFFFFIFLSVRWYGCQCLHNKHVSV